MVMVLKDALTHTSSGSQKTAQSMSQKLLTGVRENSYYKSNTYWR